jgi:hypothetical protein
MVKILGIPFEPYVDTQVKIRQDRLSKTLRTPEDLIVFNNNTAWIRLTSGVVIDREKAKQLVPILGISEDQIIGTNLAKNLMLFGGVARLQQGNTVTRPGGVGYGLNNAYGYLSTTAEGLKPFPGLESMTCNYKNNGSLRQASIQIKCFTRAQFEAIEALYLRLGYTLVLEWGNSSWFDNKNQYKYENTSLANIPGKFLQKVEGNNVEEFKRSIEDLRRKTGGNYDAIVGRVSNYEWKLESDLSFSITVHLITTGDIVDSLKVNINRPTQTSTPTVPATQPGGESFFNILLNKQTSQLHTFFYELYENRFKPLLQGYGTSQTRQIVEKLDTTVAFVEALPAVKEKYIEILNNWRNRYIDSFNTGLTIYRNSSINEYRVRTVQEEDLQNWNTILQLLGVTQDKAFTMFDDPNEQTGAVDKFAACLNTIQTFIENIQVTEEEQTLDLVGYLKSGYNNGNLAETRLISTLSTGFLDREELYEIPNSEYSDGLGDYIFTDILEASLGIDG